MTKNKKRVHSNYGANINFQIYSLSVIWLLWTYSQKAKVKLKMAILLNYKLEQLNRVGKFTLYLCQN
jgi:hypothetical protein